MKALISILTSLTILSGCMVKVTPKKNSTAPETETESEAGGGDASGGGPKEGNSGDETALSQKVSEPTLRFRGLAPHHYKAEVLWPQGGETVTVEVNGVTSFSGSSAKKQKYAFDLDRNKNYLVHLYKGDPNHLQNPVRQWEFLTPVDVELPNAEVDAAVKSASPRVEIQAQRVFLNKAKDNGPSLVTAGRDLVISTNELISNNGSIITFPKGQHASVDMAGRSGGNIFIKAKSARGELTIEMRGEQGGDGSAGAPFSERAADGVVGTSGQSTPPGTMGVGLPPCFVEPTSGGAGAPGSVGRPGHNGKRGGNTGHLYLEVAEKNEAFQMHFSKEIGRSGHPGSGGPGQLGGFGGQPGGRDPFKLCRYKVSRGPDGANGAVGANGVAEGDGQEELDCISVGEGFGRCSNH